jgi:hypothetical protein
VILIDIRAAEKGKQLFRFCKAFSIQAITFQDSLIYLIGKGIPRPASFGHTKDIVEQQERRPTLIKTLVFEKEKTDQAGKIPSNFPP